MRSARIRYDGKRMKPNMNQSRYVCDKRNRGTPCNGMPCNDTPNPCRRQPGYEGNSDGNRQSGCYSLCGHAYAMAYIPMQRFENLYTPEEGLCAGTLFRDLDLPFCGESISGSAYPIAPARTCSCSRCGMSRDKDSERGAYCTVRRGDMGDMDDRRGGSGHG